jgi:hypothetical protein
MIISKPSFVDEQVRTLGLSLRKKTNHNKSLFQESFQGCFYSFGHGPPPRWFQQKMKALKFNQSKCGKSNKSNSMSHIRKFNFQF